MSGVSRIQGFVTGDYLAPVGHRFAGQRIVAVAYLVRHPDATILFDTGFPFDEPITIDEGGDPIETYPRSLVACIKSVGSSIDDIDIVANCHLHIDHAGGNFRLPAELPICVQQVELAAAQIDDDPIVRDALAVDRQAYRSVVGEHELVADVWLIPTPGHTPGHQSMVVQTDGGTVVLAGQAVPSATDFAAAMYAVRLETEGGTPVPSYPTWLPRLLEFEPGRVLFGHDLAVWEADD
jgi:glyoxylase-like metal-dependent hydrolase (beta-lactamase superfamily II)